MTKTITFKWKKRAEKYTLKFAQKKKTLKQILEIKLPCTKYCLNPDILTPIIKEWLQQKRVQFNSSNEDWINLKELLEELKQ